LLRIEMNTLYYGPEKINERLYYDYFSFNSELGKIENPEKIYKSKNFIKDRDLTRGKNEADLERYMHSIILGKK